VSYDWAHSKYWQHANIIKVVSFLFTDVLFWEANEIIVKLETSIKVLQIVDGENFGLHI
jgi:hypothetical protein